MPLVEAPVREHGPVSDNERRWELFDHHSAYVDRFGLLLLVTAVAVITLSLVDLESVEASLTSQLSDVLVSVFVGATLLLALRASGVGRQFRILADVLVGLGVLGTVLVVLLAEDTSRELIAGPAAPVIWVPLSVIAPVFVIRRLVQHERASGATLLGALSAYLLIAVAFTLGFLTIESHNSVDFFGSPQPTTSFMYFSLVTITTLGYGDLAPVDEMGRLLATIEAVIGQVYLVTFVAMIVGLMVEQRQRASDS